MTEQNEQPTAEVNMEEVMSEQDASSVEQIAKEVLAGKWGRGQMRKKRLQEAGHDPAAVAEAVTKLINGT